MHLWINEFKSELTLHLSLKFSPNVFLRKPLAVSSMLSNREFIKISVYNCDLIVVSQLTQRQCIQNQKVKQA